jgi:hypothetical protein
MRQRQTSFDRLHFSEDAMINSEEPNAGPDDATVERIVSEGPSGAIALAGIATAIVVLIWVLFYLLVFIPRSG